MTNLSHFYKDFLSRLGIYPSLIISDESVDYLVIVKFMSPKIAK